MRIAKFVLVFFVSILILTTILVTGYYFSIPKLEENVTILVLGKGGEGHTAPNLTDTIMVMSLNKDTKKVNVLSLPRDIWIPEIRAKLNTAYHYGGFKMAGDSVASIIGLPISHTVVVDFSLFKDFIDAMSGINVTIDNSFVDEKYPIAGLENDLCNGDPLYKCRYETLTFDQGNQEMNGETALKFVRSRNAKGDEGTDIAREKRQQKVVSAIKDKLASQDIFLKPKVIKNLYMTLMSHVETDINSDKYLTLLKFLFESRDNINFLSIPEEMLEVSQNDRKYDRQYVFIPKSGSWKEFQEWLTNQPN